MNEILDVGLEITRWLQQNYPWLRGFMAFMSQMGRFEFYLVLVPIIYWAIDKQLGRSLTYILTFSDVTNNLLKHAFRGPRPYWLDQSVSLSSEDTSYGIPSGHSQTAFIIYLYLAIWLRRRWVWALALLMVFLMGLSRIYLGVHFLHDVLAGYLVGLLILVGYLLWWRYLQDNFRRRILGQRLLLAIIIPLAFGLIYALVLYLIGQPDLSVAWSSYLPELEAESVQSMFSSLGALLGVGCGLVLEGSRVRFRAGGPIWKRAVRVILGLIGAVAFWRGLALVFPTDPLWLGLPLRALRYFLLGIWVSYYGPMVFVRLRLADADPPPGIELTIRPLDRIQPPK